MARKAKRQEGQGISNVRVMYMEMKLQITKRRRSTCTCSTTTSTSTLPQKKKQLYRLERAVAGCVIMPDKVMQEGKQVRHHPVACCSECSPFITFYSIFLHIPLPLPPPATSTTPRLYLLVRVHSRTVGKL